VFYMLHLCASPKPGKTLISNALCCGPFCVHLFEVFVVRKCDMISSVDKTFHPAILWFWVLIEVSSKLQCYLVMDPIKHFWYLIRVELL
jgi:hypothetical protein